VVILHKDRSKSCSFDTHKMCALVTPCSEIENTRLNRRLKPMGSNGRAAARASSTAVQVDVDE
jgi:hypothetical protein